MKTITTSVFTFDELNDRAKESAREWYRGCMDSIELDCTLEDIDTAAGILGISINGRAVKLYGGGTRHEPAIYYDLDRGSGRISFNGTYSYAKGATKSIREYAPIDGTLSIIADGLSAIQKNNFYGLSACIRTSNRESDIRVEVESEHGDSVDDAVPELIRDFAAWAHSQLRAEWEYQYSDEAVDESIIANEYTFTEDGKREG